MKTSLQVLICGLLLVWSGSLRAQLVIWVPLEFDYGNSTSSGKITAKVSEASKTDEKAEEWASIETGLVAREVQANGHYLNSAKATLGTDLCMPCFSGGELFRWGVALQGRAEQLHDQEGSFSCTVDGTWTLHWELTPFHPLLRGQRITVLFALPYKIVPLPEGLEECANASSEVTFTVTLTIGKNAFAYELNYSACPPRLRVNRPNPLEITVVDAKFGDTVTLSVGIDADANGKTSESEEYSSYMGPPIQMSLYLGAYYDPFTTIPRCDPNAYLVAPCLNGSWHPIDFPSCDCPSACPPGKLGETIEADSGEQMEVWWVAEPFPHYELRYYPTGDPVGYPISEAVFGEGCNYAEYYAPDDNNNGKPDRFCLTTWHNWDFGQDHGVPRYLDHWLERYDVLTNRFSVIQFLHEYPPGCTAPVEASTCWCDLTQLKKECLPTSAGILSVTPLITGLALGDQIGQPLIDQLTALSPSMPLNPGQTTIMGHLPVRLCDMDWDGDCDVEDIKAVAEALGSCRQDANYRALADIDGDGCIGTCDLVSLSRAAQSILDAGGLVNPSKLASLTRDSDFGRINKWWEGADMKGSGAVGWPSLPFFAEEWLNYIP